MSEKFSRSNFSKDPGAKSLMRRGDFRGGGVVRSTAEHEATGPRQGVSKGAAWEG